MLKTAQKIFLAIFLTLSLAVFPNLVSAQTSANQTVTIDPSTINQTSPYYANIIIINLVHTLSCLGEGKSIVGLPCINSLTLGTSSTSPPIYRASLQSNGGALGSVSDILALMYTTPPLRTSEYLADLNKNFGLIPSAKAQVSGSGNAVLLPVYKLWQLARNLSYLAMIFIFIVVGVMIMFRSKINPQTVISVQKALPGLVVGLILITFSYFLSALIVDLSFVTTQLGAYTLEQGGIIAKGTSGTLLANNNIFVIFNDFLRLDGNMWVVIDTTVKTLDFFKQGLVGAIVKSIAAWFGCQLGMNVAGILPGGGLIGNIIGCAAGGAVFVVGVDQTPIVGWFVGFLLYVILLVALLVSMFKVVFALIQCYVTVIVLTITAPFRFLTASIPGREKGIGDWIKEMFANLLTFPTVFLALIFAAYIMGPSNTGFGLESPLIAEGPGYNTSGGSTLPLLSGLSSSFLKLILGYGVLLMLPAIPDSVKSAFGVKDNQLFAKTAFGSLSAAQNLTKGFGSRLIKPYQTSAAAYKDAVFKARYSPGGPVRPPDEPNRLIKWLAGNPK